MLEIAKGWTVFLCTAAMGGTVGACIVQELNDAGCTDICAIERGSGERLGVVAFTHDRLSL